MLVGFITASAGRERGDAVATAALNSCSALLSRFMDGWSQAQIQITPVCCKCQHDKTLFTTFWLFYSVFTLYEQFPNCTGRNQLWGILDLALHKGCSSNEGCSNVGSSINRTQQCDEPTENYIFILLETKPRAKRELVLDLQLSDVNTHCSKWMLMFLNMNSYITGYISS